ncbi:MAG: FixH family protein [Pseudomonadota bacterium]
MTEELKKTKPLTGRKVLAIACGGFGVIIAANLTLAVAAVGTFPGLEVANGYIASQTFEDERAAQVRLGWSAKADYDGETVAVALTDRAGDAPRLSDIAIRIGRPTTEAVDVTPEFYETAKGYATKAKLAPGLWRVDVAATGANGEAFRQQLVIEAGR